MIQEAFPPIHGHGRASSGYYVDNAIEEFDLETKLTLSGSKGLLVAISAGAGPSALTCHG
jgi:hypothetical protein